MASVNCLSEELIKEIRSAMTTPTALPH